MLESFRYCLQGCEETERDVYSIIQLTPRSQLAPNTIPPTLIHKGNLIEGALKSLLIVQYFISSYVL